MDGMDIDSGFERVVPYTIGSATTNERCQGFFFPRRNVCILKKTKSYSLRQVKKLSKKEQPVMDKIFDIDASIASKLQGMVKQKNSSKDIGKIFNEIYHASLNNLVDMIIDG